MTVVKEIASRLSTVRLICPHNGQQVAIKTSAPELVKREVEIIRRLGDMNGIPKIIWHSETEICFEKLNEFKFKLDLVDIRKYLCQLAEILCNLHSSGIAHLDISPGNLMLDGSNCLVLIDFQLARRHNEEIPLGCGTPGYIPPEVYHGTKTGFAADIYSAGIILGSLLEPYIPEIPLHNLGSQFLNQFAVDSICCGAKEYAYSNAPVSVTRMAADLISKMLKTDPRERISAKEILSHPFALARASEFFGLTFDVVSKNPLIPRKSDRRRPVIVYRN